MTRYHDRLQEGHYEATSSETQEPDEPDTEAEPVKLPGQHAGLDELALERGHDWSSDDLTVAEKQAELNGL